MPYLQRVRPVPDRTTPRKTGRRAAVAVEAAFIAPFLVLLFLAVADFARVFYYQVEITNCARNGALYGSNLRSYQETAWIDPYNDVKKATVASGIDLSPALATSQVNVTSGKGSDGNSNITVTVTYPFQTILSYSSYGTTLNLQAQVSMRVAP